MRKFLMMMLAIMLTATMSFAETKENSINEGEAVAAIQKSLTNDGVKISKYLVNKVMDKAHDLTIEALKRGQAIKVQGVGTLEVKDHQARHYRVPDENGTLRDVDAPAGKHVTFVISRGLYKDINTLLE